MSHHNYYLAFRFANYLGYGSKNIFPKWTYWKIKKIYKFSNKSVQMKLYNEIINELSCIKKYLM